MEKTEKVYFKVVGMYCATCRPIVEKQLKGEQAITKIEIDVMTDRVIVEYDPSAISRDEIRRRLENSGYKFVSLATR